MSFLFWLFAIALCGLILGAFVQAIFMPEGARRVTNQLRYGQPGAPPEPVRYYKTVDE
jgi:hypothetical protein